MDQPGDTTTPYVVTLVHGTFAKGAAWTREGSALHRALTQGLGPRAHIQFFDWSGRNTHKARLAAGKELAALLAQSATAFPGARQVTIAHSHGGNVALYARRHAVEPGMPDHIVCLATPFLRCRMRRRLPFFTHLALLIACAYVAFLLFSLIVTVLEPALSAIGISEKSAPGFAILMLAALAWFGFIYWLARRYLQRRSAALLNDLGWPAGGPLHLLTVGYAMDEARIYLSVLDRATAGFSRLIWQVAGLLFFPVALYVTLSMYLAIYHRDIFYRPYFSMPGDAPGEYAFAPYVAGLYLAVIIFGGLGSSLLTMLRGNPYGYGWERPSTTMLLDIEAIDVPEGLETASVEHHRIEIGDFAKRGELAHCLIYEDERLLAKIVTWIKGGQATAIPAGLASPGAVAKA